jgi:hypothetical protein
MTMSPDALPGFTVDDSLSDTEGDDWSLPLGNEEDKESVPANRELAQTERSDEEMLPYLEVVEAVSVLASTALSGAASTEQYERDMPASPVPSGNEARRAESDWLGSASKGLLMCTMFLGFFFAGLQLFWANSITPPVAHQESGEVLPPEFPTVSINNAKLPDDLPNGTGQNAQPVAPIAAAPVAAKAPATPKAPARTNDARPKATVSLYDRVRQVVRENKTEETERLGIGDIAYQDVSDDGSIMVGMAVTYAPFFNHQIIKSVRPIYQGPDGKRYDGPDCGTPTATGERIVAKEGYAIGGAAIKSGMGIDGMQLTFMEIGANGLIPNKSYLSKWLGLNGGPGTKTYLNDGRPIVGIAGMRSKNLNSPAFCLCLVTTRAGALADADSPRHKSSPTTR